MNKIIADGVMKKMAEYNVEKKHLPFFYKLALLYNPDLKAIERELDKNG